MYPINVVLRNLQEMIKSDKWGHWIFAGQRFHVTPITLYNQWQKRAFQSTWWRQLKQSVETLATFLHVSLKKAERMLSLKPLSLKAKQAIIRDL